MSEFGLLGFLDLGTNLPTNHKTNKANFYKALQSFLKY